MFGANTQSYLAKNIEITRSGNTFNFKFENRIAHVSIDTRHDTATELQKAANTAAVQLFGQDVFGALLTLRLKGDKLNE